MNDRVMLETIKDLGPHAEIAHEVLTVRLPRLMQDVMHVYLDRGKRQTHVVGDMLIIFAQQNLPKHFDLARGKTVAI